MRRPLQSCFWADVALVCVAVNLIVLLVTPVVRRDLSLLENSISYYAVGPWGALQAAGFIAMGIASMTLGLAVLHVGVRARWLPLSAVMLVIAGVASLGLAWYPMDRPSPATLLGDAHQTAGTIGGVAQLVAALTFMLAIRTNPDWTGWVVPILAAFAIAVAGALLTQLAIWRPDLDLPMGATMRLVVVPLVILWGAVAIRLRRTCRVRS